MSDRPTLDALVAGFNRSPSASTSTSTTPRLGECRATGCFARLLPYALFCDRCWPNVPADVKKRIEKHHRPGRRPSKLLETFIAMAVADLLELRTTGHHIPAPTEFMWDDEPPAPVGVDEPLFPPEQTQPAETTGEQDQ